MLCHSIKNTYLYFVSFGSLAALDSHKPIYILTLTYTYTQAYTGIYIHNAYTVLHIYTKFSIIAYMRI